jgi:transposase InsO family protein
MVKLDEDGIRWIIKCKDEGRKNAYIANVQKITVRRVQRIYSLYRKNNKTIPTMRKSGRHARPITIQEREIVRQVRKRFHANAACLERYIKKMHGIKTNHNRIHCIMPDEGLSVEQPRKKTRRKWTRYERENSNSIWHTDWHEIKDSRRGEGKQLMAYEDDASRFIISYGVFDGATSENSVSVLKCATKRHGSRPVSILSDNGSPFTGNEPDSYGNAPNIL